MKRLWKLLLLTVIFSLVLVACGGGETEDTAEPAATEESSSATPTTEPTPALSEETETPMNTYIVGALIGLVVVFAGAAWVRAQRGKK